MSRVFASSTSSSCCIGLRVTTAGRPRHGQARAGSGSSVAGKPARRRPPAGPGAAAASCCAGAVAAHAHVVHDPVHVCLPVTQLLLPAPAAPDLVVGPLATGERRPFGVPDSRYAAWRHALPQPVVDRVADLRGERLRGELRCPAGTPCGPGSSARKSRLRAGWSPAGFVETPAPPVGAGVRGPVEHVGVLPFRTEVVDPKLLS